MKLVILVTTIATFFSLASAVSLEQDLSLTLRQKQTLDKFRERVAPLLKHDYMKNDIYLIRWLRARDFNLDAAETMLKENLQWRKEAKMDTIGKENFDDMSKDFHLTIDTYDKQGRPIGVIDMYSWDIRQAIVQGRGQRLLRYMDYLMENITGQVFERQAKGMNVTQWKVLVNTNDFNMVQHACPICIPVWIQFVNSLENHYPGWMDELIAIDAPSAVNVIVEILRPFLSKNTRENLRILNANRKRWMNYLDERISRNERRAAYGGTKPEPAY